MKLIDIMKRYNKCILKENAKLRSIYNTLIRECDGADAENECDVSECDANEAEGTKMSIAEFLGECDKEDGAKEGATDECDACGDDSCKDGEKCGLKEGEDNTDDSSKKEQIDEVNDGDLMTAEEFFGDKKKGGEKKGGAEGKDETKADECDACGDDSCKDGEKCGLKEGEDEIEEDDELISKKEFYAANESEEEIDEEDEEEIDEEDEEEIDEEDEETTEDSGKEDVTESKKEDEKKELDESLEEHYRAANRKLFNV